MDPLYFLFLMKVNNFGFRVSGFDEAQTIGEDGKLSQGPNAVLSMLDWAFRHHSAPGSAFSIHADNCLGRLIECLILLSRI
ncbi:hypothetical protein DPMN_154435 [Dreissena polymorpha]|uniref:Uncharacterized protein n=1 Tax=Dreissena polymorpha TaxID=45954 RepID=A0A9D4FRS6_DREPO|nr:hypothetical protein DPMN_154435 [Dreissena polymorpha]